MPASVFYPRISLCVPPASKQLFYEQLEDFDAQWVDDWAHAPHTELELDLRPLPEVPTDGDPWGWDDFESTVLLQSVDNMPTTSQVEAELDNPDHLHHEANEDEDYENDDDDFFFDFGEDDDDAFVENDEVFFRPVSPDITPEDDAEEEVVTDALLRLVSPCVDAADVSSCTSDSVCPSQDPGDVDEDVEQDVEEDVNAAPVSRSRLRGYTFPVADLTNQEMSSWPKEKRTAFALERCLIGPDVIFRCAVPKSNGQPCGKPFTRREIRKARKHFRSAHFPKAQQKKTKIVLCPWPGCGVKCAYRETGRHFEDHAGISYKCPFCPRDPINRSDSFFRHMHGERCKRMRARRDPHPPTPARSEATAQPEAGPSTQRKRPPRACVQGDKPQTRARAQQTQPEAGPSQGRKRSRRCVEEEEKENIQEEDAEVDDDDDDDPAWVPNRKGKGKAKAKAREPARKRQKR